MYELDDQGAVRRREGRPLAGLLVAALVVLLVAGGGWWLTQGGTASIARLVRGGDSGPVPQAPDHAAEEQRAQAQATPEQVPPEQAMPEQVPLETDAEIPDQVAVPEPALQAAPDSSLPGPEPAEAETSAVPQMEPETPVPSRQSAPALPAQQSTASAPGEAAMLAEHPDLRTARQALEEGRTEEAVSRLQALADAGLAGAQALLGFLLAQGESVKQDREQAFALFTQAADQGHAEGQYYLANAYLYGTGTEADQVKALAWFMQAASRGHAGAIAERDRGLAELDDTGRVQADSLSRSLTPPMAAGWIRDEETGVAVWSASWYRNGTFKAKITAEAVDGLAEGEGMVALTATLYGRSDITYKGHFTKGLMLDPRLAGLDFELLDSDVVRIPISTEGSAHAAIDQVWLHTPLGGLEIPACADKAPELFVVMKDGYSGIDDDDVTAAAAAAVGLLGRFCDLDTNYPVDLVMLPREHSAGYDRGDRIYQPALAELQLYGFDRPVEDWSVNLKNHARRAHEVREHELQKQREAEERKAKAARDAAAAKTRGRPDIRGLRLGLTLPELHQALGEEAVAWDPPWRPGREMPAFRSFEQQITLADRSTIKAVFASQQNGSRLLVLVYEQLLRDGPQVETLRQQLYAKYGTPDDEAGQRSWLTWWLQSAVEGEETGAFLKGRLQTDGKTRQVTYLRLVLNDYELARLDEAQGHAARRQAEFDAYEKSKSDEVKF